MPRATGRNATPRPLTWPRATRAVPTSPHSISALMKRFITRNIRDETARTRPPFSDESSKGMLCHSGLAASSHNPNVVTAAITGNTSSHSRGRVFMGHDASMQVGSTLTVTVDSDSTRYKEKILSGVIDPELPLISYRPGANGLDAVTSASQKYYASRGLVYTYRDGRRVDTAHLHIQEWLDCIRHGGTPSCGLEKAFASAVACQMITKAYREQRRVEWNAAERRIV